MDSTNQMKYCRRNDSCGNNNYLEIMCDAQCCNSCHATYLSGPPGPSGRVGRQVRQEKQVQQARMHLI